MDNYIAVNIKYLRKVKRLSQLELGEILNVTQASQSAYERKKAVPPVEYLSKLCGNYKICLDNFVHKELWKFNESEWNSYQTNTTHEGITEVSGFKAVISEKDKRINQLEDMNVLLHDILETDKPSEIISELECKTEALEQKVSLILNALAKAKLIKNLEGLEEYIQDLERSKLEQNNNI